MRTTKRMPTPTGMHLNQYVPHKVLGTNFCVLCAMIFRGMITVKSLLKKLIQVENMFNMPHIAQ